MGSSSPRCECSKTEQSGFLNKQTISDHFDTIINNNWSGFTFALLVIYVVFDVVLKIIAYRSRILRQQKQRRENIHQKLSSILDLRQLPIQVPAPAIRRAEQ